MSHQAVTEVGYLRDRIKAQYEHYMALSTTLQEDLEQTDDKRRTNPQPFPKAS
jgi:hypothetical protein